MGLVMSVGSMVSAITSNRMGTGSASDAASSSGGASSPAISLGSASYLADDDIDKEENDRLVLQCQLASTKLDVMGVYYGAMQTAVRESGSDGIQMYRRITKLMTTENAYQETDNYKDKKDKDTFVSDQVDAISDKQEEIEKAKEKKADKAEAAEERREKSEERAEVFEEWRDAAAEKATVNKERLEKLRESHRERLEQADNAKGSFMRQSNGAVADGAMQQDKLDALSARHALARRTAESYRAVSTQFLKERELNAVLGQTVGKLNVAV